MNFRPGNSPDRSLNDYDGDGKADLAAYHQDTPSADSTDSTDSTGSPQAGSPQAGSPQAGSPQAGSGQAGIWQLFLSTSGYQELSGGFGGPQYQPVKE